MNNKYDFVKSFAECYLRNSHLSPSNPGGHSHLYPEVSDGAIVQFVGVSGTGLRQSFFTQGSTINGKVCYNFCIYTIAFYNFNN